MKKMAVFISGMMLVSFTVLHAQEEKKQADAPKPAAEAGINIKGQKLTVPQAVKLVLERNSDLLIARLDGSVTDTAYERFQSKYDVYLGSEGGVRFQDYPEAQYSKYGKKDKDYDVNASIKKMLSTGTTVTASMKEEYLQNTGSDNTLSKTYRPVMFLQVQQDLFKNFFGYSDRRNLTMLENQSQMQKNAVASRISGLVAGALVDIWDVSLKRVARDNAVMSLRETKRVRDVTANNVRLGISENYDLNFYNAMLSTYESRQLTADQQYKDSVRKLYRTLNYEFTGNVPEIEDFSILNDSLSEVDINEAMKAAYEKRADYLNAKIALDTYKAQLGIARNDALPSFQVTGSVSSLAIEKGIGKANTTSTALDTPAYALRFAASYPLESSSQDASEREAKAKLRQSELDMERIRLNVKDDVSSKAETIGVTFASYQRARTSRQEYERYYTSILANLRMGKTSSAVVKNALDAYNDSRQREHEALIQYNVSLLQFDISTNRLLEKYNIDVDKYIKEAK